MTLLDLLNLLGGFVVGMAFTCALALFFRLRDMRDRERSAEEVRHLALRFVLAYGPATARRLSGHTGLPDLIGCVALIERLVAEGLLCRLPAEDGADPAYGLTDTGKHIAVWRAS